MLLSHLQINIDVLVNGCKYRLNILKIVLRKVFLIIKGKKVVKPLRLIIILLGTIKNINFKRLDKKNMIMYGFLCFFQLL